MKLVITEKPSVAQSIAKVIGANQRKNGYLEGNGYLVSWCVGHLVELAEPEDYDEKYDKWRKEDLPIFPEIWKYQVTACTKKQYAVLKELMFREDVDSIIEATDAGREGELIFRLVYNQCNEYYHKLKKLFGADSEQEKYTFEKYSKGALKWRNMAEKIVTEELDCRDQLIKYYEQEKAERQSDIMSLDQRIEALKGEKNTFPITADSMKQINSGYVKAYNHSVSKDSEVKKYTNQFIGQILWDFLQEKK